MISISLRTAEVRIGGKVEGEVIWVPGRDVEPRNLSITARWRTEGRGDRDSKDVATSVHEPGQTIGGMPRTFRFALDIPSDGPISYDGKLIRIIWEVLVRADLPWAIDERNATPFIVLPGRPA